MINTYATLTLEKESHHEYVGNFRSPMNLGVNHNARVALCDLYYSYNSEKFDNAAVSIFDIYIPCYTNTPDGKPASIRCELENARYTPKTLCQSINNEIISKMPSDYNHNKCKFTYNSILNRVELRLDGKHPVPASERTTLVIYHPLSYYLGWTNRPDKRITFVFVSMAVEGEWGEDERVWN